MKNSFVNIFPEIIKNKNNQQGIYKINKFLQIIWQQMSKNILEQAQDLMSQKKYEDAIRILSNSLESLVEFEQSNIEACKMLELVGQCYYFQKDADNAINYFTQVRILRERPNREDSDKLLFTYNNLGLAYKLKNNLQHYKLGMNCFEKYLNLIEGHEESEEKVKGLLNLGICQKGSGEIEKALETLSQAKLINQKLVNSQEQQVTLAKILNNIGLCAKEKYMCNEALENFQLADKILKEIEIPANLIELGQLYLNIANTYFMKKEFGEAKTYYEQAHQNAKSQSRIQFIVHKLVLCYQQTGELQKAEEYCQKDISLIQEIEAKNESKKIQGLITAYTIMSQLFQQQNKYKEAIKYQEMCIQLDNSENKKMQMLALYKEAIENENQAMLIIYYLENTLNIYQSILPPSHPNIIILLEKIGRAYFDQDNYSVALEKALECCQHEPNYKFAYQLAGACQQKLENAGEAMKLYEQCVQLDSYYADPYIGIVQFVVQFIIQLEILLEQKKYQEAIDKIDEIGKLQPTSYDRNLSQQFTEKLHQLNKDSQVFAIPFLSKSIGTMEDFNISKDEKFPIEVIPIANFAFNDPGVKAKLRFFYKKAQRLLDEEKQEQQAPMEQGIQEQQLEQALENKQNENQGSIDIANEHQGVCAATCKQCIIF